METANHPDVGSRRSRYLGPALASVALLLAACSSAPSQAYRAGYRYGKQNAEARGDACFVIDAVFPVHQQSPDWTRGCIAASAKYQPRP